MRPSEAELRRQALERLEKGAERYFGAESAGARFEVVGEHRREASRLWLVDAHCGERRLGLAVKKQLVPAWEPADAGAERRYRVAATPPVAERSACEARALRAIEALVCGDSDPRFDALQVFDVAPEEHLLVMERVAGEGLDRLFATAAHRGGRSGSAAWRAACTNAGAWLRRFHDGMPRDAATPVVADRPDFERIALGKIAELEPRVGDARWWRGLRDAIAAGLDRSEAAFAAPAVAHGDFWGGNVLCRADGQVVVIDTFAAGLAPIQVDLAYFLLHLRATPAGTYGGALVCRPDVLRDGEAAFLAGYDPVQAPEVASLALFQLLVLLYKWASGVARLDDERGVGRVARRAAFAWRSVTFRRWIDEYVARLA